MDGFAAGMAVIGFGSFALLGVIKEAYFFALISAIITSVNAGFLVFNFPASENIYGGYGIFCTGLFNGCIDNLG